jgi:hypothetical protein
MEFRPSPYKHRGRNYPVEMTSLSIPQEKTEGTLRLN